MLSWAASFFYFFPSFFAKVSLSVIIPFVIVAVLFGDSRFESFLESGIVFAVWVALLYIYLPRRLLLLIGRFLAKSALFFFAPIVLFTMWEYSSGFQSILLSSILSIIWLSVFWVYYPRRFTQIALFAAFPVLIMYSWNLADDAYYKALLGILCIAWAGFLWGYSRKIAISTLLKFVIPVIWIVAFYRNSGTSLVLFLSILSVVWLAAFLWFDRAMLIRILLAMVIPSIVIIVWHVASLNGGAVIPSINEVLDVIFHPLRDPPNLDSRPFLTNIFISFFRVSVGFSLAALTGVFVGILVGRWKIADRIIGPVIEMARPICPIAWLPVAIIVFGFSSFGSTIWGDVSYKYDTFDQMKYAMVFIIWWGAFFPIVVNTISGVRGVRKLYIDAALVLGVERKDLFFKVILPASLPSIVTGLRVGMGIAWMVIVAAEFFPGTSSGLGFMITTSHQVAEYEYAFASIIAIGVVGLVINRAMMSFSEKVNRWESRVR